MATDSVKVLYIMGLFRSGSTVLDIILGNHDRLVSVGELRSLPEVGWRHGGVCACGETAEACGFWSDVRRRWTAAVGGEDQIDRMIELQNYFERLRAVPRHLVASPFPRSRRLREYGDLVHALYRAIAAVSGKSIIVDSTKYPGRAMALRRTPGIDVHLLHLVRDGRAVIWSVHRKRNVDLRDRVVEMDRDEVAKITTYQWMGINGLSGLVARTAPTRTMRLRYEDFIARPREELGRVGRMLDVDLDAVARRLVGGDTLQVGHMIAGNRVRNEGAIRLRPDLEWHERLPAEDRRVFWTRAGWLARRYGYHMDPPPPPVTTLSDGSIAHPPPS